MKKNLKWKLIGILYFTLVLTATPLSALAYIDPSVSSYMIQAIAGIIVAVGAFIAIYWRKAKKKVQDKLGIDDNSKKEKEEDIQIYTQDDK